MNDKQMQEMFDIFLNRNGSLGEYYSALIERRGVDSAIVEYVSEGESCPWYDAISLMHRKSQSVKWYALHEMWQKEIREAGL